MAVAAALTLVWQPAEAAMRAVWQIQEPARGVPAIDRDSVYVLTQTHELIAADRASGRVRWRVPTDSTGDTFGSRVVVHGDVVVAGDYDLIGVDRTSGQRRWQLGMPDTAGAAIHLGDAAEGTAYAGSLAGALHAVDIATGALRWTTRMGGGDSTVYAPVVGRGLVVATFSTFDDRPSGGVMAVDAATGRHKWTRVIAGSAGASGRPAIAGGVVMAASRDGTIHAFDAESGEPRWVWPGVPRLSTELDYRPLASDARLVVAGSLSGEVVAHDIVSRRVVWRRTPAVASVAFDLLVHRGIAYVPFYSGQVVALRLRDGVELWRVGGGPDRFTWVPAVDNADVVVSGARTLVLFRRSVAVPRGEGR